MRPKVSIIVPVYNTLKTLEKCVKSLLNQTLENIEIILVDDGSPDGAGELCDTYLFDKRIKVIHKKNGGLSSARNAGIQIATGEYIGFVDSDDYVSEQMFEKMYFQVVVANADVGICAHYTVGSTGETKEHYFENMPNILEKADIQEYLLLPLIGPETGKNTSLEGFVCRNIYKNEIIKSILFESERVYFAEDVVFNLEVYEKCNKVCIINECLYFYLYNEESLSNRYREGVSVLLENLLLWEKQYLRSHSLTEAGIHRLYATGIKFVFFSIANLNKRGCNLTKQEKDAELKRILSQEMFAECIREINLSLWGWKMRIFILLCKLKWTNVLIKLI